jgi:hypothetical protein
MLPQALIDDLKTLFRNHNVPLAVVSCLYGFDKMENCDTIAKYSTVVINGYGYRNELGEMKAGVNGNAVFAQLCEDMDLLEKRVR